MGWLGVGLVVSLGHMADYYTETAQNYDAMHLIESDEHERAFRMFFGWLPFMGVSTILDVGAGTGRVQQLAKECGVTADILGTEPVAAR